MKIILRALLLSALILILLMAACTLPAETPPTPLGTILATGQVTPTATPTSTPSNETPAAFIPITGMDVVSLQCQFCVNEEAHAVLIMSDQVFFNVSDPATGVSCLTAQEINGRRILLCRGAQQASFQLNVCVDDSNCLQFPITFQTCPLIPQTGLGITFTPVAPILLTPINTLIPEEETEEPREPSPPRPTRTPGVTPPPGPTSTVEPPPTEESTEPPPPTEEPTDPPETQEPTEPPIDPP